MQNLKLILELLTLPKNPLEASFLISNSVKLS